MLSKQYLQHELEEMIEIRKEIDEKIAYLQKLLQLDKQAQDKEVKDGD